MPASAIAALGRVEHEASHLGRVELDETRERCRRREGAIVQGADRCRVVDQRGPQTRRPDVDDEDHGASCMLSRAESLGLQTLAEDAAHQPGAEVTDRLNNSANQWTSLPRTRRISDEHRLGEEIRADGGDDAVAQWKPDTLAPTPHSRHRARIRAPRRSRGTWRGWSRRGRPPIGCRSRTARRTPARPSRRP